jgi:hypothetical protein
MGAAASKDRIPAFANTSRDLLPLCDRPEGSRRAASISTSGGASMREMNEQQRRVALRFADVALPDYATDWE